MYTYQQRLEYIQRLQELVVIKSNIHLTYKYKNQNKAIAQVHTLQDKIINSIIDEALYGNSTGIKNIDSTIEELMQTTLENERKRIHHEPDRYVDRAVELNTQRYSEILTNRINTEAIKLQAKIESELRSGIHQGLSEAQTKNILREKYGDTAKARIKNIIRDSVHTNESNISFINALNEGYTYKVWMNGAGKGKVRNWHRAKYISPVPIEDYFTITGGPYGTRSSMYPGDLYSGAENVANCRCWLRYTNRRPEGLEKPSNTFNIPSTSYLHPWNNPRPNADTGRVKVNPIETIRTTISETTKKVTSKIKKIGKNLTSKIKRPKTHSKNYNVKGKPKSKNKKFNNFKNTQFKRDLSKSVTFNGKKSYGVSEDLSEKRKFGRKMGIKETELTLDELKFVKLYSGDGFSHLNDYLREIKGVLNPFKRRKIWKKYSKLWDESFKGQPCYMPMDKAIKVGKNLFKKGKILENDLVVVRRQDTPLTDYNTDGVYTNDGFLSTSISGELEEYGDYKNHIRIPKGEKILYIECVTVKSGDFEVLLPPGTKLHQLEQRSDKLQEWTM